MSTPTDIVTRAVLGVATMGMSEVPGQFRTSLNAVKGATQGKLPNLKDVTSGGSPLDAMMPNAPKMPNAPTMSPLTTPSIGANTSPSSTLRKRRNFSTLLTGSQGDTSSTAVARTTLLGGQSGTLGK